MKLNTQRLSSSLALVLSLAAGAAGLLTTSAAHAESARVLSFAGHRLMEDPTDVFMFPGLLFAHSNRLHVDFEPNAQSGQGGLTFGDDRIIGVHVGRGMLRHHPRTLIPAGSVILSDFEEFADVLRGHQVQELPAPGMVADVLFGLPTGLGFRLSIANSIVDTISTTTPPPDPVPDDVCGTNETGTEFRTLEAGAGWSQRTADRKTDIGGTISLHTVKRVTQGCLDAEAIGTPSVAAAARVAFRMDDRMELGVLGQVEMRDRSVEFSRLEVDTERSVMAVTAGVGPRYALSNDVKAVATAVIGMSLGSGKFRQDAETPATELSTTRYILPGIDLALEAKWKEWLTARAGVLNRYVITTAEQDNGTVKIESVTTSSEHLAAAGVGIHWGRFTLDGAFNVPLLTSGPNFVGGQAPGLFSELSLGYSWGGADDAALSPQPTPSYAPPAGAAPYPGADPRRPGARPGDRPDRGYVPPSLPQQPTPRYEPPPPPPTPTYEDPNDPYWGPR